MPLAPPLIAVLNAVNMLSVAGFSLAFLIVAFAAGCSQQWDGYAYPSRANLSQHVYVGKFDTLEACRAATQRKLLQISSFQAGDYECGRNCKSRSEFGSVRVCDLTTR